MTPTRPPHDEAARLHIAESARGSIPTETYQGVSEHMSTFGQTHKKTETFAALKLFVDNWRWSGMPFYLRTGKCMPEKLSEIVVRFQSPPLTLFQKQCESAVYPNDLIIRVQPEEGIEWRINGKVPGGTMNIKPVNLDFFYANTFNVEPPEAYERLTYEGEKNLVAEAALADDYDRAVVGDRGGRGVQLAGEAFHPEHLVRGLHRHAVQVGGEARRAGRHGESAGQRPDLDRLGGAQPGAAARLIAGKRHRRNGFRCHTPLPVHHPSAVPHPSRARTGCLRASPNRAHPPEQRSTGGDQSV